MGSLVLNSNADTFCERSKLETDERKEIIACFLNNVHQRNTDQTSISPNQFSLTGNLLEALVLVGAEQTPYEEATAENPAVDALEDDDEDDDELNASASNDYPDGENDNDESYDDNDDDRQESRITEQWIKPNGRNDCA